MKKNNLHFIYTLIVNILLVIIPAFISGFFAYLTYLLIQGFNTELMLIVLVSIISIPLTATIVIIGFVFFLIAFINVLRYYIKKEKGDFLAILSLIYGALILIYSLRVFVLQYLVYQIIVILIGIILVVYFLYNRNYQKKLREDNN